MELWINGPYKNSSGEPNNQFIVSTSFDWWVHCILFTNVNPKKEIKLQMEDCLVNSSFPIITNSLLQELSHHFEPLQLVQILGRSNFVTCNLANSRMNLHKERVNNAIQHRPPMGSIKVLKSPIIKRNKSNYWTFSSLLGGSK